MKPVCENAKLAVIETKTGYGVVEISTGKRVGYSYQYITYDDTVWHNYYSAMGFAQKLHKQIFGYCN